MRLFAYVISVLLFAMLFPTACRESREQPVRNQGKERTGGGCLTDAGSRYAFAFPERDRWMNGFCGPFRLGTDQREWISDCLVKVCFEDEEQSVAYLPDTIVHHPGRLYMKASSAKGSIEQELVFVNAATVLVSIRSERLSLFRFFGRSSSCDVSCAAEKNTLLMTEPSGEGVAVSFSPETGILAGEGGYETLSVRAGQEDVVISFFTDPASQRMAILKAASVRIGTFDSRSDSCAIIHR